MRRPPRTVPHDRIIGMSQKSYVAHRVGVKDPCADSVRWCRFSCHRPGDHGVGLCLDGTSRGRLTSDLTIRLGTPRYESPTYALLTLIGVRLTYGEERSHELLPVGVGLLATCARYAEGEQAGLTMFTAAASTRRSVGRLDRRAPAPTKANRACGTSLGSHPSTPQCPGAGNVFSWGGCHVNSPIYSMTAP